MEDGGEGVDEIPEEEKDDDIVSSAPTRKNDVKKKTCNFQCNTRIDELATPHKRMFLALWNEHAHHLPSEKVKHLKQLLQQLYAMTPEETAKYFAELKAEAKAAAMRKKLKQRLRKYLLEKHRQKQRERAYKLFKRLLKCGMTYAAENPVPPLVSIRLRYLSDIILEQLCDLRKVAVPNRSNTDKLGYFLISVADWMAIAVERLYYAAQLSINEMTDYEQLSAQHPDETAAAPDMHQPLASSTPKKPPPDSCRDADQPVAASTPKKQPSDPYYTLVGAEPVATSTPRKTPHDTMHASSVKKRHVEAPPFSFRETESPAAASTLRNRIYSKDTTSGYGTGQMSSLQSTTATDQKADIRSESRGQYGMSPSYQKMRGK